MEYRDRVRLDRYAVKNPDAQLQINDMVVASLQRKFDRTGRPVESREIGWVQSVNPDGTYDVKLDTDGTTEPKIPRSRLDYVTEKTYPDICRRVATAISTVEKKKDRKKFAEAVETAMVAERFVPAGRILSGLGRPGYDLTLFNCYVFNITQDSRRGITEHWGRLFETYSRGGGVGTPLSVLRPKGTVVRKVNGRSSGSVSWAEQFSQITGAVEQGGCFALYSKIDTPEGPVAANELANKYNQGTTVYVSTHCGAKRITNVFRNGIKPTYRIGVRCGRDVHVTTVSDDHKIITNRQTDAPVETMPGWYFVDVANAAPGIDVAVLKNNDVVVGQITEVLYVGEQETVDFEVADVHILSSDGIYTSNSRRGAAMLCQWCWHPDVLELVDVKALREEILLPDGKTFSRNKNLLCNANVSILLTEGFMRAVQQNADWDLVFPDTDAPGYDAQWNGDIWRWRDELKKPVVVYRTIKARDLWNRIIQHAWEAGEPGIIFMERANQMSNSWYYAPLIGTNPCITGDMRTYTKTGIFQIVDNTQTISPLLQDARTYERSYAKGKPFFITGVKDVVKLSTVEGYTLRCTPDHKVMTPNGWCRVENLRPGDRVHILNRGGAFGSEGTKELGYVLGWLVGDGHVSGERAVLDFYETKKCLAQTFADWTFSLVKGTERAQREYTITPSYVEATDKYTFGTTRLCRLLSDFGVDRNNLKRVPGIIWKSTKQTQRAFLRALYSADGTVNNGGEKGCSVRLDSISLELLTEVQLLLLNFGIASHVYKFRTQGGYRMMPDGKGGQAEYWCEPFHTLAISKQNLIKFQQRIGFLLRYKNKALAAYLDIKTRGPYSESFTARVASITPDGNETIYDSTVPATHAYIANGFICHNCSEQVLPDNAVCNLAHLNLGRYVTTATLPRTVQTTAQAKRAFDWETLKADVQMGVRFLDNVNDLNVYHDDAVKKQQLSERRIGLGILGYGDALMRLGLCYGSDDATAFTNELMRVFTTTAYKASVQLAKERGAFPRFQADHFLNSGFMKQMPKDVRALVRRHGIRNVTITTIAPTGSTSVLMNTSTGCEPFFDLQYTSTTRIGIVKEKSGVVDQIFQQFGTEPQKWPPYVVTAQRGITPEHHVKTQAAMQRWIDSAIAKTINLPANATVKDVADAYMLMWELGCKGGTVYRDGSRDVQVLYTDKPVPVQVVEASSEIDFVRPRPDAGISVTFSEESPIGTIHMTIRHDPQTGDPIDVFVVTGKGDASADAQALGRLMSMILRFPDDQKINQQRRMELIRNQLSDILGRGQVGLGPDAKRSMPDAIAKILTRYLEADFPVANLPFGLQQMKYLLDELRTCGGDTTKLDQISGFILEGDPGNGHDVDEYRAEMETEIQKAEQDGIKLPYDYCPGCGNCTLVIIPGKCPCCRTCGYTQC